MLQDMEKCNFALLWNAVEDEKYNFTLSYNMMNLDEFICSSDCEITTFTEKNGL